MSNLHVVLITALMLGMGACDSQLEIMSGLSEHDANEISVVLYGQKIDATKTLVPGGAGKADTYTIGVKSSQAPEGMKILVDNKLPRTKSDGLAAVFPIGSGGLIPTSGEEKAKLLMAMQGEIENMLKVLPGFVQAKVVIVLPNTDVIRDTNAPPPQATASVAIVYNPIDDKGTPSVTADDVKYLVASSVEDLAAASVTVVMASNVPMKLVDIASNHGVATLTSKPGSVALPPNTAAATVSKPIPLPEEKTSWLTWLFGALAFAGVAVGVMGQIRSRRNTAITPTNLEEG